MFDFAANSLARKMPNAGDRIYDDMGFRYTLLDNLPLLKMREDSSDISVNKAEADQFFGDFYGLLCYIGVPKELYWITTIMNGLDCSTDYNSDFMDITIPAHAEIDRIKTLYLSRNQ